MKEYFEALTDIRQQAKVLHNFTEIVTMVVCAVIAGCDVREDIADYCRVKEQWLRERIGLKLENGVPSHDTLSRVFGMLDPTEFQGKFIEWAQAACGKHSREILSLDGKTMRGSRNGEEKPVHMVSAWASKAKAVFGQLAVDEKSNEITAVPALLELLDIKGCIITADAMSCQKEIVRKIADGEADYTIGLKENQATLCHAAQEHFDAVFKEPTLYDPLATVVTREKGHGRIETRTYYLCTDPDFLKIYQPAWKKPKRYRHDDFKG